MGDLVKAGYRERKEVLCDGGVVLLRPGGSTDVRWRLRRAFRLWHGCAFAWLIDDRALELTLSQWHCVVGAGMLPAAVVVPAARLQSEKEKSARLAQAGGLLGVFLDREQAMAWLRRQALVYLHEASWRMKSLVVPLHKRGRDEWGQ